jgi:hypothetical protein
MNHRKGHTQGITMEEKMISPPVMLLAIFAPICRKQLIIKYQKVMWWEVCFLPFPATPQPFNYQQ